MGRYSKNTLSEASGPDGGECQDCVRLKFDVVGFCRWETTFFKFALSISCVEV